MVGEPEPALVIAVRPSELAEARGRRPHSSGLWTAESVRERSNLAALLNECRKTLRNAAALRAVN